MEREIKFRVWTGTKIIGFDNHTYTLEYNDISGWNVHPNIPNYKGKYTAGQAAEEEGFKLIQFTGLKDKNGEEIYEDDILLLGGLYVKVFFKNGSFHVGLNNEEGSNYFNQERAKNSIVIGNIFENPELLES